MRKHFLNQEQLDQFRRLVQSLPKIAAGYENEKGISIKNLWKSHLIKILLTNLWVNLFNSLKFLSESVNKMSININRAAGDYCWRGITYKRLKNE